MVSDILSVNATIHDKYDIQNDEIKALQSIIARLNVKLMRELNDQDISRKRITRLQADNDSKQRKSKINRRSFIKVQELIVKMEKAEMLLLEERERMNNLKKQLFKSRSLEMAQTVASVPLKLCCGSSSAKVDFNSRLWNALHSHQHHLILSSQPLYTPLHAIDHFTKDGPSNRVKNLRKQTSSTALGKSSSLLGKRLSTSSFAHISPKVDSNLRKRASINKILDSKTSTTSNYSFDGTQDTRIKNDDVQVLLAIIERQSQLMDFSLSSSFGESIHFEDLPLDSADDLRIIQLEKSWNEINEQYFAIAGQWKTLGMAQEQFAISTAKLERDKQSFWQCKINDQHDRLNEIMHMSREQLDGGSLDIQSVQRNFDEQLQDAVTVDSINKSIFSLHIINDQSTVELDESRQLVMMDDGFNARSSLQDEQNMRAKIIECKKVRFNPEVERLFYEE